MNDEFLLSGETARTLFHEVGEVAPIVDLHNHLPAPDITGDRVFETLTDLWLGGDTTSGAQCVSPGSTRS